jgi:hypothetical protein
MALIRDPHIIRHASPIWCPPNGHPGASQYLTATLYMYKQHTHIETYSQMEITHSVIFNNQILNKVFIVSTTKFMYQLTITQRITII